MVGKAWGAFGRGERVGLPDFERVAEIGPRDALDQLVARFVVGDDAPQPFYVLSGFAATAAGTVLTVAIGAAIVGYKDRGVVHYGALVGEGDATQSRDLAALDDDTPLGVYLRLDYTPGKFKNRPHWNPLGSPNPTEEIRNIPTQRLERWSFAVEETTPGPEWMKIWDVEKSAGALTLTDQRRFYFEGRASTSFEPDATEWGSANDRNGNRDTFGLFGLARFIRAMQGLLTEIKGQAWWTENAGSEDGSDGARSLSELNDEKLARNGAQKMEGNLDPDPTETHSLGSTLLRWLKLWVEDIDISGSVVSDLDIVGQTIAGGGLTVLGGADITGGTVVTGSVGVTVDYLYQTPLPVHHTIAGIDHVSGSVGAAPLIDHTADPNDPTLAAAGWTEKSSTGNAAELWRIHIPNGVNVVTATINGDFVSGTVKARGAIIRVPLSGGDAVSYTLGGYVDIDTTGGITAVDIPISASLIINNDAYAYFFWVGFEPGANDNTWEIYSLHLDYELTFNDYV